MNVSNPGPERVELKNGLAMTVEIVITDATLFRRYVMQEHAPKAQGDLALGKSPARYNLENALYDQVSGWLDDATTLGLSVTAVKVQPKPGFENRPLGAAQRIAFSEIVSILSELYNIGTANDGVRADSNRLKTLRARAYTVLANIGHVDFDDIKAKPVVPQVGDRVL